jgi:hypothetical protein
MKANSGCAASSAFASSMEALQQPTIRIIAIIAEGVPEADAKKLIAYARANNKVFDTPSSHTPWKLTHYVSSTCKLVPLVCLNYVQHELIKIPGNQVVTSL